MLNRTPGSTGRRWHAHGYRQGQHETEDPAGGGNERPPSREFLPLQCVRTLCYPEGMGVDDGGGELAVVPGAHLYQSPYLWNTRRSEFDEEFQAGWMRGRVHAFTGEPLRIEPLSLNPGSMVSFVHHMPHRRGLPRRGRPHPLGAADGLPHTRPGVASGTLERGRPGPLGGARRRPRAGSAHRCAGSSRETTRRPEGRRRRRQGWPRRSIRGGTLRKRSRPDGQCCTRNPARIRLLRHPGASCCLRSPYNSGTARSGALRARRIPAQGRSWSSPSFARFLPARRH